MLFSIFCDLTLATAQNNLIKTIPKFTKTTKSYEIKQTCESIVIAIDKALPELKKIEKKLLYDNVSKTPVTIWYSNNNVPVKIECAVTDDSGAFTDKVKYYFINGQFFYSDQIFARYIFDSNKLIFWMDENWNINEIPLNNFKDREMFLNSEVKRLLSDNN
jgi:hypothetical protein